MALDFMLNMLSKKVVLPAPKNPVITVTPIRSILVLPGYNGQHYSYLIISAHHLAYTTCAPFYRATESTDA